VTGQPFIIVKGRFADKPTGTSDLTFSRLDERIGLLSTIDAERQG